MLLTPKTINISAQLYAAQNRLNLQRQGKILQNKTGARLKTHQQMQILMAWTAESFNLHLQEERFQCLKALVRWNHLRLWIWSFLVSVNANEVLSSPFDPANQQGQVQHKCTAEYINSRTNKFKSSHLMNKEKLRRQIWWGVHLLFCFGFEFALFFLIPL